MNVSGKDIYVAYAGKQQRLLNQRCEQWTEDYGYQGAYASLKSAGCGIFSIANAVSFMSGLEVDVPALAVFAKAHGARDNTGTDRPTLLRAMQENGLAARYLFSYSMEDLRNDLDALKSHLLSGGAALCNLRSGHIVALIGIENVQGETLVIAADPYAESDDARVMPHVKKVYPGSEIIVPVVSDAGVCVGAQVHYAMYHVPLAIVKDFNLLHPLKG